MQDLILSAMNQAFDTLGTTITLVTYYSRNTADTVIQATLGPDEEVRSGFTTFANTPINAGHVEEERIPNGQKVHIVRKRKSVLWWSKITFTPKQNDEVKIGADTWLVDKADTDQAQATWELHLRLT